MMATKRYEVAYSATDGNLHWFRVGQNCTEISAYEWGDSESPSWIEITVKNGEDILFEAPMHKIDHVIWRDEQ